MDGFALMQAPFSDLFKGTASKPPPTLIHLHKSSPPPSQKEKNKLNLAFRMSTKIAKAIIDDHKEIKSCYEVRGSFIQIHSFPLADESSHRLLE